MKTIIKILIAGLLCTTIACRKKQALQKPIPWRIVKNPIDSFLQTKCICGITIENIFNKNVSVSFIVFNKNVIDSTFYENQQNYYFIQSCFNIYDSKNGFSSFFYNNCYFSKSP
jgi:hypothetical protein